MSGSEHAKKREHYARLEISAENPEELYEITLTYIKVLSGHGAWDFEMKSPDSKTNIVIFQYNGGVSAIDAISKLPRFNFEYSVKSNWKYIPVNDALGENP